MPYETPEQYLGTASAQVEKNFDDCMAHNQRELRSMGAMTLMGSGIYLAMRRDPQMNVWLRLGFGVAWTVAVFSTAMYLRNQADCSRERTANLAQVRCAAAKMKPSPTWE